MGAPAQGQEGPCLVERSVLSTVKLSVILCPRSHNQSSGAAPASWIPSAPASHGQVLMRTGQALRPGRSPTLNLLLPSPVKFGTSRLGAGPLDPQRLRFFLEPIAGQLVLHVPWGLLHWPQTRLSPLQGQKGGGAGGLGPGQGTCQRERSQALASPWVIPQVWTFPNPTGTMYTLSILEEEDVPLTPNQALLLQPGVPARPPHPSCHCP